MEQYFKGKTVLVTGAGWGIGAATALLYASCGAKVIVSDTSRKGGKYTVAKIRSRNGNAIYIKTDVSNAAACEKLIKRAISLYGCIDIACNNSAVFCEPLLPADKAVSTFDTQVSLNCNGLQNCMRYEIEAMQKQGGGIIINTSSIVGTVDLAQLNHYVDAKYGMSTLLQNMPGQYPGIHIDTIAPAFINSALLEDLLQKETNEGVISFPLGRHAGIREVASLILWLSSNKVYLLPALFNDTN